MRTNWKLRAGLIAALVALAGVFAMPLTQQFMGVEQDRYMNRGWSTVVLADGSSFEVDIPAAEARAEIERAKPGRLVQLGTGEDFVAPSSVAAVHPYDLPSAGDWLPVATVTVEGLDRPIRLVEVDREVVDGLVAAVNAARRNEVPGELVGIPFEGRYHKDMAHVAWVDPAKVVRIEWHHDREFAAP